MYETRNVAHWNFILNICWISVGYLLGVFWDIFWDRLGVFPECVARVPLSLWGCEGRAVFAGRCGYVRKRP